MTAGGRGRVVYIVPSFVYSLRSRVAHSGQRCVETGGPGHAGLCKWGCKLAFLPLSVDLCTRITPPQTSGCLKGAVISEYHCCCPFRRVSRHAPFPASHANTSLYNRKDELGALIRLSSGRIVSDM